MVVEPRMADQYPVGLVSAVTLMLLSTYSIIEYLEVYFDLEFPTVPTDFINPSTSHS